FAPLVAARAGDAGVDHRGRGALRSRPAVHLRGVPEPAAAPDAARGGPHGQLRLRAAAEAGVGEEPGGPVGLQHLPPRRAAARTDWPAGTRQCRRGALPGRRAVPLLRGAARREAHLLGDLRRARGGDPARQANAARSARVAAAGSLASPPHTAPMTATPAAPAFASAPTLAGVTPPIAITGSPAGASRASAANRPGERGGVARRRVLHPDLHHGRPRPPPRPPGGRRPRRTAP